MAGVKKTEETLCVSANLFSRNPAKKEELLIAALAYAKAKKKTRDNRDKWKAKRFQRIEAMPYMGTKVIACGFVTGATGAFAGRGATVAHPGAGLYDITPDQQCDPTQKIISAICFNAAGALVNVLADTDAVVRLGTFSLPAGLAGGPVAADRDFYFEIKSMDLV